MILGLALGDWFTIIQGVLAFPTNALALIKALQKTPAEQQQALVAQIQAQAEAFAQTGRPS